MRSSRCWRTSALAAVLIAPLFVAQACGPDFHPDTFVRRNAPDNKAEFAFGRLGIVQAGFDSNEYAVAFRYLNGGVLSHEEHDAYAPPSARAAEQFRDWRTLTPEQIAAAQAAGREATTNSSAPGQWQLLRAKFATGSASVTKPNFPTDYSGNIVFDPSYLNCPDAAFLTATATLQKRSEVWTAQSRWLADWIQAQDAVFSNCGGKQIVLPVAAAAGAPALLQADRAYQIAAAEFYARQYDAAAQQFTAIAADKNSPWNEWGHYLAARSLVRKAFALGKATDPYGGDVATYDDATMRQAQKILEAELAGSHPAPSRLAVARELNFIRIRTEPERRIAEIGAALAGPEPDPNFKLDLDDLSWVLGRNISIKSPPPMMEWIAGWRGAGTADAAYQHWREGRGLPWLVMALVKAGAADSFAPALLAEAARIPPGTPAYETVLYQRVRLLIALHRDQDAREILDAEIAALHGNAPGSRLNALLGQRMQVARNFDEFLQFAPRTVLELQSEGFADLEEPCFAARRDNRASPPCSPDKHPEAFDTDSVDIFNREMPLELLVRAAATPTLPVKLRQNLAMVAWVRAVILEDASDAQKLAPLLPASLRSSAAAGVGFKATLAILRNPGLRPYLEPGVPRVASFSEFNELRDNWWSGIREAPYETPSNFNPEPVDASVFLGKEVVTVGEVESAKLNQQPGAVVLLGRRVLEHARQDPTEADVPEALALTVRAGHYAIEDGRNKNESAERTAIGKAAFQLLHSRYARSDWAAKTRYYY